MGFNVSADSTMSKIANYGVAGYVALGLVALWLLKKLFFFLKGRGRRKKGGLLGGIL